MTVIIVGVVLLVAIIFYFNLKSNQPTYMWFENYRANNNQPYGASFIHKMLEGYRPGSKFILNDKTPLSYLLKDVKSPDETDYVFVGHNLFLDEESTGTLARFIEAGGNAFVASLNPPERLLDAVYFKECGVPVEYRSNFVAKVDLNFFHNDLKTEDSVPFAYRFATQDRPYNWGYLRHEIFCDSTRSVAALGSMDKDMVNFVKIPIGKGSLYLHSSPLVFTNYFLTDPRKVAYASSVFSHLDGKDLIWDEFSKIPISGENNSYNSPLYYILQQPSLKYAWWLLLFTVVIYVVFASKRKQRAIPVREPKSNTSLEFINMISGLHYKNGNHLDMAHKKMKYFLYFVRSKYGIHAEKFRDEHIRRLAEKSKVNLTDVEVIFSRYYLIEQKFKTNIEANRLVDLYDSIDNFYKQSK